MKFNFMIALLATTVAVSGCAKTDSKSGSKSDSAKSESAKTESAKTGSAKTESAKTETAKTDSANATGAKTTEVELTEAQMIEAEMAKLSPEDRAIAEKQKICPLAKKPLGYMPGLKKVELDGDRIIFVCCEGCENPLRKNPDKWLANLAWYQGMPEKKQD